MTSENTITGCRDTGRNWSPGLRVTLRRQSVLRHSDSVPSGCLFFLRGVAMRGSWVSCSGSPDVDHGTIRFFVRRGVPSACPLCAALRELDKVRLSERQLSAELDYLTDDGRGLPATLAGL